MSHSGLDSAELLAEKFEDIGFTSRNEQSVSIRNRFHRILTVAEALADGLTVAIAVFAGGFAYHALELGRRIDYSFESLCLAASGMAVLYVILLDRDGAYRPGNSLLRIKETERTLRVSTQAFLLVLPITFFSGHTLSRLVFVIALVFVPVLHVAEKQLLFVVIRALRSKGVGVQRVIIYGAGASGRRVFSALVRSPKLGLHPVALVDDKQELEGKEIFASGYRRARSIKVIQGPVSRDLLEYYRCDFLMVAIPSIDGGKFAELLRIAGDAKARMAFVPGDAAGPGYWTEKTDIDGIMLNVVGRPAAEWLYEGAKRPFDFLAALMLIGLVAPVWLAIACLIQLDSPGPILFRQRRVGKNGKPFDLYKFRTMRVDAPHYALSPKESDDPRITRFGRSLRRASLDELPQLLNVLKGEMSLVGPRPEMPFIVERYNAQHRQRLQVTPGITGLWQLSADRAYLIHENLQYDLYYIRNRSFFMDFAILLHTLVFAMRGV